jgi:hypothetical protein
MSSTNAGIRPRVSRRPLRSHPCSRRGRKLAYACGHVRTQETTQSTACLAGCRGAGTPIATRRASILPMNAHRKRVRSKRARSLNSWGLGRSPSVSPLRSLKPRPRWRSTTSKRSGDAIDRRQHRPERRHIAADVSSIVRPPSLPRSGAQSSSSQCFNAIVSTYSCSRLGAASERRETTRPQRASQVVAAGTPRATRGASIRP